MRIIVDTNIAFSAILNTNSKIGKIILHPKSKCNFYSTNNLKIELEKHKNKLKRISGYNDKEFQEVYTLITSQIRFIDIALVPITIYKRALLLTETIDIDDTEFVALAEHSKARLWTGDKNLMHGLQKVGWNKLVSTNELYDLITKKNR
jgi:predicted nucleic acid-binding protein